MRVRKKDPLPNMNGVIRRQPRTSFQGLGVIGGKERKLERYVSDKNAFFHSIIRLLIYFSFSDNIDLKKVERMKIDRRKRSIDIMRKSAQSDQIRHILENTLEQCVTEANKEGTGEERLQAVLTKAKESGMTADNIFSFFNGGNPNTTQITKKSFLASIQKLCDTLVSISEAELTEIVKKFDKNQDGKISIAEFKHYCYNEIQSVAWRAERTRLEKSGEMKMLKAQISRRFKPSDISDENDCGEEVHRTSKFFWKANNNVEIRIFFTESLNVITLQLYSQTIEKELPSVYVCRNKLTFQHALHKEDMSKAMKNIEGLVADPESAKKNACWDSIAKYIVARLKLWERNDSEENNEIPLEECAHIPEDSTFVPYLCKLTGTLLYIILCLYTY